MHTCAQVSIPVCIQRPEEDTGSLICQPLNYLTELIAKLAASRPHFPTTVLGLHVGMWPNWVFMCIPGTWMQVLKQCGFYLLRHHPGHNHKHSSVMNADPGSGHGSVAPSCTLQVSAAGNLCVCCTETVWLEPTCSLQGALSRLPACSHAGPR